MKKFVRVIYRIPKLILQFIWNLIEWLPIDYVKEERLS